MYYALAIILGALATLLLAWPGLRTDYSAWQIRQKRQQNRSARAKLDLERLRLKPSLLTLQVLTWLIISLVLFASLRQLFGFALSLALSFVAALVSSVLAKLKFIQIWSNQIYHKIEAQLLFLARLFNFVSLRSLRTNNAAQPEQLESLDELRFLIDNSPAVINDRQRTLIDAALKFDQAVVEQLMLPLAEVLSLGQNDLIGPLALDELHRTGAEYFPVLDANDQLVGILHLVDLVSLNDKTSRSAKELCEREVLRVRAEDSLTSVLNQFLLEQKSVAAVYRRQQIVGLLRLNDIIASLIGTKL